jgi:hypothetical protein
MNRCRQAPDQIARRGRAAFVGWCSRAARCSTLRSKLWSRGGSLGAWVMPGLGAT